MSDPRFVTGFDLWRDGVNKIAITHYTAKKGQRVDVMPLRQYLARENGGSFLGWMFNSTPVERYDQELYDDVIGGLIDGAVTVRMKMLHRWLQCVEQDGRPIRWGTS